MSSARTGRRYTVPVAYIRDQVALLIGTPFGWGRNLRTGEPVTIRFRGRQRLADVQVLSTEADVVDAYATMARDNTSPGSTGSGSIRRAPRTSGPASGMGREGGPSGCIRDRERRPPRRSRGIAPETGHSGHRARPAWAIPSAR